MLEQGKYVEYGTPPHFPPPKELEGWVQRKWGANQNDKKEKSFILARHIAKHGTRPYPFIRPTFNTEVVEIIRDSLKSSFK